MAAEDIELSKVVMLVRTRGSEGFRGEDHNAVSDVSRRYLEVVEPEFTFRQCPFLVALRMKSSLCIYRLDLRE